MFTTCLSCKLTTHSLGICESKYFCYYRYGRCPPTVVHGSREWTKIVRSKRRARTMRHVVRTVMTGLVMRTLIAGDSDWIRDNASNGRNCKCRVNNSNRKPAFAPVVLSNPIDRYARRILIAGMQRAPAAKSTSPAANQAREIENGHQFHHGSNSLSRAEY